MANAINFRNVDFTEGLLIGLPGYARIPRSLLDIDQSSPASQLLPAADFNNPATNLPTNGLVRLRHTGLGSGTMLKLVNSGTGTSESITVPTIASSGVGLSISHASGGASEVSNASGLLSVSKASTGAGPVATIANAGTGNGLGITTTGDGIGLFSTSSGAGNNIEVLGLGAGTGIHVQKGGTSIGVLVDVATVAGVGVGVVISHVNGGASENSSALGLLEVTKTSSGTGVVANLINNGSGVTLQLSNGLAGAGGSSCIQIQEYLNTSVGQAAIIFNGAGTRAAAIMKNGTPANPFIISTRASIAGAASAIQITVGDNLNDAAVAGVAGNGATITTGAASAGNGGVVAGGNLALIFGAGAGGGANGQVTFAGHLAGSALAANAAMLAGNSDSVIPVIFNGAAFRIPLYT